MSMSLTRREKILIIVGSIVITLALYLVYFLVPFLHKSSDVDKQLSDAQSQVSTLDAKIAGAASLEKQISQLNEQIKTQWSSVPTGMDHARILLYLKQLTDGRSENVMINVPEAVQADGAFLTQTFTLDFNTTYPQFVDILADLKINELFNKVKLIKADYQIPVVAVENTPGSTASAQPTPTPDKNVIDVHIEFAFYALPPTAGESPQPAMTPTVTARSKDLMPVVK